MNKIIFIKSVFCSIYSLIIPSNIKNKTIQEKDRIELFYLDINDNKIKRCGMIQSVTDIREQRLDLNFPENIDISGKFSRIRLDSTAPFFNDVVRAGSQRYAFIAKHY